VAHVITKQNGLITTWSDFSLFPICSWNVPSDERSSQSGIYR